MALLSEAPHALADAGSDFIAFGLLLWYGKESALDKSRWHLVLALLLLCAVVWIGFELWDRIKLENYPVDGFWAFGGAASDWFVHNLRYRFLNAGGATSKVRNGALRHIESDIMHSKVALALAVIMMFLDLISQHWLMKWFDAGLTVFLMARMVKLTYLTAIGKGCGHDHGPDEGHHHHDGEQCSGHHH